MDNLRPHASMWRLESDILPLAKRRSASHTWAHEKILTFHPILLFFVTVTSKTASNLRPLASAHLPVCIGTVSKNAVNY